MPIDDARLPAAPLLWEQHCCLPLSPAAQVGELARYARRGGSLVSASYTRWGPIEFMPPEQLLQVEAALRGRGYPAEAVEAILGGNFGRVAAQVWQEAG